MTKMNLIVTACLTKGYAYTRATFYAEKELELPFQPFIGLRIQYPRSEAESDDSHEVTIESMVWLVAEQKFECYCEELDFEYDDLSVMEADAVEFEKCGFLVSRFSMQTPATEFGQEG